MIPNTIHYVFGLDPEFGGKRFSYIHYLAIRTAHFVNKPDQIIFHCEHEPDGPWWKAARALLTVNHIRAPRSIFGRPLDHYAHRADVVRLEILRRHGGIYLDLDVMCIRPLAPLRTHALVMGIEPNVGLCNAVLLARPNAPFLELWYERYRQFDAGMWNMHSVVVPYLLSQSNPELVHVLNEYAFFFPTYDDPMHSWLWNSGPTWRQRIEAVVRDLRQAKYKDPRLPRRRMPHVWHALAGRNWYYDRLRQSYCMHLWESLWWSTYLRDLTPKDRNRSCGLFWKLLNETLPPELFEATVDHS